MKWDLNAGDRQCLGNLEDMVVEDNFFTCCCCLHDSGKSLAMLRV